jgi:hypothetical protein
MMSVLEKLKIVAITPKRALSVEQERRNKLARKLEEQLKLAEAKLGGPAYDRTKFHWHTDENGDRKRITRSVRLREWWVESPTGSIQFGLRYGAAPVEIQKGRNAVEVAKLEDLPATIKLLMKAVTEGELDDAIRFAATSRAPKLKRKAA